MFRYIALLSIFIGISSCRPEVFPPKPPGYFRIETPARHAYQLFDDPTFPYSFEYPTYSNIQRDTVFADGKYDNRYWINIYIQGMGGVINITYKTITPQEPFNKLINDAYEYSFFHHEKADYMHTEGFTNQYGASGVLYTVGGNSASRYQFTATDSVKHFMRGALYFDVTPNADSLAPATDFLQEDIQHMLLTMRWRDPK